MKKKPTTKRKVPANKTPKTRERDITDKKDKRNTGWFSPTQASEAGAIIFKSLRNGLPVAASCVSETKPDYPDVKPLGPVGVAIKQSTKYPAPVDTKKAKKLASHFDSLKSIMSGGGVYKTSAEDILDHKNDLNAILNDPWVNRNLQDRPRRERDRGALVANVPN